MKNFMILILGGCELLYLLAVVIIAIPGTIVFDWIPMLFGYKGAEQWYMDKYDTDSHSLFYILYLPFTIFICYIINYLLSH